MFYINIIGCGIVGRATLNHIFINSSIKHDKLDITLIDTDEVLEEIMTDSFIKKVVQRLRCKTKTIEDFISSYKSSVNKKQIYIICIPTDYNYCIDSLWISDVHSYITLLKNEYVIIRSTLSLDYSAELPFNNNVIYVPEFLRENHLRLDYNKEINIVGLNTQNKDLSSIRILKIVSMFFKTSSDLNIVDIKTACVIKLSTNSYLSLRLVFFNQLNQLGEKYNLDPNLISILCKNDNRVGDYYNSEPYLPLGKCLPKDTKTLYNDSKDTSNKSLMSVLEPILQYQ